MSETKHTESSALARGRKTVTMQSGGEIYATIQVGPGVTIRNNDANDSWDVYYQHDGERHVHREETFIWDALSWALDMLQTREEIARAALAKAGVE